ncbi:hypothetical protein E6H28_04345 [Candidatus Bathyarchaeota archaeon]|nr:MAG: hypothetical protein E6H28_04345 [Candidatus Bathyarchaeota archaeon]
MPEESKDPPTSISEEITMTRYTHEGRILNRLTSAFARFGHVKSWTRGQLGRTWSLIARLSSITRFLVISVVLAIIVAYVVSPTAAGPIFGAIVGSYLAYVVQQQSQLSSRSRELNHEIVDQVLGPVYAETRRLEEKLTLMKEGKDLEVETSFIAQVALNWRYYRLGKQLRIDMEEFRKLIVGLGEAKQLTKDLASKILIDNASKFFNVRDVKNAILGSIAP